MEKNSNLIYISISMLLAVLILYYSLAQSEPSGGKKGIQTDKIKHFIVYALLSISLYMSKMPKKHAFIMAGTYGLLIEFMQAGLASRVFDPFDIIANYLGAGIVIFLRSENGKRIAGKI